MHYTRLEFWMRMAIIGSQKVWEWLKVCLGREGGGGGKSENFLYDLGIYEPDG